MARSRCNYQDIRHKLLSTYDFFLRKYGSKETALSEALSILDTYSPVCDKRFIKGLKNELLFYHLHKDEFNLKVSTSTNDRYFKFDFVGKHPKTRRLMFIDVTSNIRVKSRKIAEYRELYISLDQLGVNGDYFIAIIDEDNYKISPVLIPVHKDGAFGYTVFSLVYEKKEGPLVQPWGDITILFITEEKEEKYSSFNVIDSQYIDTVVFWPTLTEYAYLNICSWSKISEDFKRYIRKDREIYAHVIRKVSCGYPLAILEQQYITTDHEGGGYWTFLTTWRNPVLDKEMKLHLIFGDILDEPAINL